MTDLAAVKAALKTQAVETPSWAYGNSGTRFKVFAQAGVPRSPWEKLQDAARVHAVTGSRRPSPCTSPGTRWRTTRRSRSTPRSGACGWARSTPTPSRTTTTGWAASAIRTRRCGARPSTTCCGASTSWTPPGRGISSCGSPTAPTTPGGTTSVPGRDRLAEGLAEVYARLGEGQRMLLEYKFFEPAFYTTDVPDWGTAYALLPQAR